MYTRNLQVRIRITRPAVMDRRSEPDSTGVTATTPNVSGPTRSRALGASSLVTLGILASRITGFVRDRVFAHFFGISVVADVFRAALRIPNLLSNLFGEGVLSASFVTVYAKLRALKEDQEAEHLAEAIFGILTLVCAAMVLAGVLLTPILIDFIAPGFRGAERELTIRVVRVLFPGSGFLVMSAWCLGILNSHRKFLLSYLAPVAWSATMIVALELFGGHGTLPQLAIQLAWAAVLGAALQFLVQLPKVLEILPALRPSLDTSSVHVRTVIRNFGPIFLSRGVVQISAYVDQIIGSYLPHGAISALSYAQTIAVLPVSLFSMSVSAAELPTLSSAVGNQEEVAAFLRRRLTSGLRRIAYFVIPSAAAFLILGDVLAAGIYQTGQFVHGNAVYVWGVLAGSAVGLLATSLGRLYSSAFYALLDTKTPLRFAVVRIALTTALGAVCALLLPGWLGIDARWGVAGLTASAGVAGWVEFLLLRRGLSRRIGATPLPAGFAAKLWFTALVGAALGYSIKRSLGVFGANHPISLAILVCAVYGAVYAGGTWLLGVEEARGTVRSVLRRL
ncbi:MAG TPA: murein biosynthesis integral membrane protein MurJ [Bryobacteraceae bacterium]|nr:murein biosynthesis integral membrane protein MurJ [Bryobacteraceae bacterium]